MAKPLLQKTGLELLKELLLANWPKKTSLDHSEEALSCQPSDILPVSAATRACKSVEVTTKQAFYLSTR